MNWNFLDIIGLILDALSLLSNSSSNTNYNNNSKTKKKIKYLKEKISAAAFLISGLLLFFVFKNPLPVENYTQTLIVISLIGLAISLLLFFILYVLGKYYFKSVFQWLFFSSSVILLFISLVFCFYFKSGIFI